MWNIFRGFGGHPSHPPLTDVGIGAYTTGTILVVAGWAGLFNDQASLTKAGALAIGVGLVFALPTVLTGLADYLSISKGTGLRTTTNFHWIVMVAATGAFALAEFLLRDSLDTGSVAGGAVAVTVGAFALLSIGGYLGGTIVYEYGMRVRDKTENVPAADALKPKWPPFDEAWGETQASPQGQRAPYEPAR